MTYEPDISPATALDDEAREKLRAAGKAAVAAMLVTTLTATPLSPDQVPLPEPTPIVQIYQPPADEPPTIVDDQAPDKTALWKKVLKVLKYVLIALILAAVCLFGAVKGCASCSTVAVPAVPESTDGDSSESGESTEAK